MKKEELYRRIEAHGKALQVIFGLSGDPVTLCHKLRRIETAFSRVSVAYCNGQASSEQINAAGDKAAEKVYALLGERARECLVINRDPRGYALKIDDAYMRAHKLALVTDWGGYGLIAPDLREGY